MARNNTFQIRVNSMKRQANKLIFEADQSEKIYNRHPHIFHCLANLPEERVLTAKELYEMFPGITMMEAGMIFKYMDLFFPNKIELIRNGDNIPKCKIPAFLER